MSDSEKRPTPPYRRRDIVERIQRLYERGGALNISAVKRHRPALIRDVYAVVPFWGWKQALADAGINYSQIRMELEELIKCQICGEEKAALQVHIHFRHGINKDEYQQDYPGSPMKSEACRSRSMNRNLRRGKTRRLILPHWEPIWTPEYVLDRVHAIHQAGHAVNEVAILKDECCLCSQALDYFGSWDEVLRRVGLDPVRVRQWMPPELWTKDFVISELQRLRAEGEGLMAEDLRQSHRNGLRDAAVRLYGRYDEALIAAGITPSEIRPVTPSVYTEEDRQRLLAAARALAALPEGPRVKAVGKFRAKYAAILAKFYGASCWAKVAVEIGVDPMLLRPSTFRYPMPEDVKREIRRRHREGLGANYGSVARSPQRDIALLKSAEHFFGSWDDAIEAAGLSLKKVRVRPRNPYRDEKALLEGIRKRRREGLSLHGPAVLRDDKALFYKARTVHGCWSRAVMAAGFDYDGIIAKQSRRFR